MNTDLPFNIWIEESAYLHVQINVKNISKEDQYDFAQELLTSIIATSRGNSFPILFDLRNSSGDIMVELGRRLSENELLRYGCLAEAFVVGSLGTRLLVNFYKRIYKKIHPAEIFADIHPAREWIKEFAKIN